MVTVVKGYGGYGELFLLATVARRWLEEVCRGAEKYIEEQLYKSFAFNNLNTFILKQKY